jgi:hypothetical protein
MMPKTPMPLPQKEEDLKNRMENSHLKECQKKKKRKKNLDKYLLRNNLKFLTQLKNILIRI